MPPQRIELAHTIEFKIRMVQEYRKVSPSVTRSDFVADKNFSRTTHKCWDNNMERMLAAASNKSAKKLTVGGSGRKSLSAPVEDVLCLWIKDQRREERAVSKDAIIQKCEHLLPGFMNGKSDTARKSWCTQFMARSRLTIRKISQSGRTKHPQLLALKERFAYEVTGLLMDYVLQVDSALPPPFVLYNMDQTAVDCDFGATSTVEFMGATRVAAKGGGKGSYRGTLALLICAEGRMLTPHFIFKGEPDKDVYQQLQYFCEPSVATFSVQENAWFDERVMHEWIDRVWQFEVSGPTVLILDSLRIHRCTSVRERLAQMGTYTVYVPGGSTGVAQPLDVGVMSPFKKSLRERYTELYTASKPLSTARERRIDMFQRSVYALGSISEDTIKNAFHKAGPFIPFETASK